MPTWNTQQMKAITTKNKNILVSASAGSGKTTVLIARLIDLVLKDNISINQILAMTFTEAAANEMKKRLASELHAILETSDSEEEKAYISKQLTDLQNAYISTIHSFCLSILQDYYYTIGIDGGRVHNIMDNASMNLYQQQAMDQSFQVEYELQDPAFLELCMIFSARPHSDESLSFAIQNLAQLASSKPNPDAWLLDLIKPYDHITSINAFPKPILSMFFDYLNIQISIYEEYINKVKNLYEFKYCEETKKYQSLLKKMDGFDAIKQAILTYDYNAFRTAFIGICHIITPPSPDKEDTIYLKIRKQITALEDHLLAILYEESTFIKENEKMGVYIEKLISMCMHYRDAYAKIKEKHNVIDFDDMEHFALQILQANDHAVATIYKERFEEIMVDEFQDSNDVQNELVNLICRHNNVFRVGDIKQSIYGFRHAKPQLMKGLIDHKNEYDEVIYLSNNYRSKKMIVDFNNELYKRLMNLDGFDCSYAKEDDVETGIPQQLENNVPIKFHLIDHFKIKEDNDLIISKHDLKAGYIANQIIEIKNKQQKQWKEFVVLVRGNALKDHLKAAFDAVNIPYFIDIKHGFYQSTSLQIVLSFLRACIHPHDDISFIAMITSPLFQFTMEEIASVKLKMAKDESFYEYFKQHYQDRIQIFLDLKAQLYTLSISDMLNKVFNIQHYYQNHTTLQEKTNLDLLYEKAVQFEEKQAKGIASFIEEIDKIKDAKTAEAIPIGSDENVVRVMSIHQSKGLQFPVVFLWSNTNQVPIEFKELFISDSDLGIGMKTMQLPQRFVRTSLQRIAMEHKKNKEELEEEMRILYVATTRAQQQMHIIDCIKSREEYDDDLSMASIYARDGYTSWILKSFQNQNNPLFQILPVANYWNTEIQPIEEKPMHEIRQYNKEITSIRVKTASSIKASTELTKLKFHDNTQAERGTLLHEVIEVLPYPYDENIIHKCINDMNVQINDEDIHALMMLKENEIFKKANDYSNVSHELAFMVKDDHQILHGFMDFVAISETDIIIIDFKSDHISDRQQFITRYKEQLETYKKAMSILHPNKKIHCYIYSLSLHTDIFII